METVQFEESSPKMKRSICASYQSETIHIANPERVRSKIAQIRTDGPKNLNLISDFDFTLTRRSVDGQWADSSYKVLSSSPLLSEEYKKESKRLYEQYAPIEKDNLMPVEKKSVHMLDWWQKSLDLIVKESLTKQIIKLSCIVSDLYFRFGIKEFLQTLKESDVHCYLVSAGFKPVINQSFAIFEGQTGTDMKDKITICSTEEIYNEDERICGFNEPVITCSNKFLLFTHSRYPNIKQGSNAIVMGDLLEDLSITSNLKLSTTLTIGMLNSTDSVQLEEYKKVFDIVIQGDGNLVHIAQIIQGVCMKKAVDYDKYGDNAKIIASMLD